MPPLFLLPSRLGLVRPSPKWPSRFVLSDAIRTYVSPSSRQFFGRLSSALIRLALCRTDHGSIIAVDNTGTKVSHFLCDARHEEMLVSDVSLHWC
jgi:hypothetical protein